MSEPFLPGDGESLLPLGGIGRPDVCQLSASLVSEIDVGDRESSAGAHISFEEYERREEGGHAYPLQKFPFRDVLFGDPPPAIGIVEGA